MAGFAAALEEMVFDPDKSMHEAGGISFDPRSGQDFFQAAERVQPVDSLGAGDTFNAASLAALALGASVPQMLRCACAVAGRKGRAAGWGPIPPDEDG
eukprot:g3717.t1